MKKIFWIPALIVSLVLSSILIVTLTKVSQVFAQNKSTTKARRVILAQVEATDITMPQRQMPINQSDNQMPLLQAPASEQTIEPAQLPTLSVPELSDSEAKQANKIYIGDQVLNLEYELDFEPEKLRDPFEEPKIEKEVKDILSTDENQLEEEKVISQISANPYLAYPLDKYKIVAILWGVQSPKALVRIPSGQVLTVLPSMRLGRENAVVWTIREKEVVLLLPDVDGELKNGNFKILQILN